MFHKHCLNHNLESRLGPQNQAGKRGKKAYLQQTGFDGEVYVLYYSRRKLEDRKMLTIAHWGFQLTPTDDTF